MRILVLGGTRFVGRALVDQAVSRGHDVTTFTRGRHGEPRPGAEALHGDRTRHADLRPLADRDWDAVIDTSVLAPAHVTASARLLAGHAGQYVYVSSLAVYPGRAAEQAGEESATYPCPPDAAGDEESLGYGPLKAGSERAVAEAFAGRHLIVRPGVLAGPHDNAGGLPWWLARFALGGRMLAPGDPGRPAWLTDARDLAAWILGSVRRKITGTVNVPGQGGQTFGDLMTACRSVTGARGAAAELVWVPDEVLLAADVEPCTGLPMWVPDAHGPRGLPGASGERARLAGMRYRPLGDTVRDTWGWLSGEAAARGTPVDDLAQRRLALNREREQRILAGLAR